MIRIDIKKETLSYQLFDEYKELINNSRARIFIEQFLNGQIIDKNILIPYGIHQSETLTRIREGLLKKYGIEEEDSALLKNELSDYLLEEENFEKFSIKAEKIRNNDVEFKDLSDFNEVIKAKLIRLPYKLQLLSAFHLAFSQNSCNFSVPGAGKTTVVYCAFSYLNSISDTKKHVDKLLVVGPLSSFGPWETEYEKCFGKKAISKRISGKLTKTDRDYIFYNPKETDLILISYQSLASNEESIIQFLKKNKVMVVLDEAHKIKNIENGIWSEITLRLSEYCKSRVVLTGTPAPNGYEDLYNLCKFIWPNKNVAGFHKTQLKQLTKNKNPEMIKTLTRNISPFFVRVTKKDLNLPASIVRDPVVCRMDNMQREVYSIIENSYLRFIKSKSKKHITGGMFSQARLIRLMQLATNVNLLKEPLDKYYSDLGFSDAIFIDDSKIINIIKNYNGIPEKFIEAKNIIDNIISSGGKVVVWSSFVKNILDFSDFLASNKIESKCLYGLTPIDNENSAIEQETRESIVSEFNEPDAFKVLIANPFAASESISLHKECHNAIYLDRTFNATNFIQSKDRIHRVGLKRDVVTNYYYLESENTIDEVIGRRLVEKEKAMLEIIENEAIPLFSIGSDNDTGSDDDIKALIKSYDQRTPDISK